MIQYTTYQPEYKDQIVELILDIQQNEFQVPVTLADQPDLLVIPDFYQVNNGNFWVALHGDEVVGTIALINCGEGVGCIRKMFVKAEFRSHHGIAQHLLNTLTDYAKQQNINALYLGTVAKLKAAIRFYERNGFSFLEKNKLPKQFPLMAVDTHFYQKEI
jgi:N-acetylglutamate synthase-like GNAT family acetyltransferase